MTLTIDLESGLVTIGGARGARWRPTTTQWVEFYAALAAARLTGMKDGWVTANTLRELRGWRSKRFASIGKVVARHLQTLKARHGLQVVESRQVTARWRLNLRERDIVVLPDVELLPAWLDARRDGALPQALSTTWVAASTRALLALHLGHNDEAYRNARAALDASGFDERCTRIAAFILARVAATKGDLALARDEVERVLADRLGLAARTERELWGTDPLGRHMRLRLAALAAIESDAASASAQIGHLHSRLESARGGADKVGLAVLHNVIGLLYLRQKRHAEAEHHLAEAITLALTASDLFTLGGAIFNLGRSLMLQARDGRPGAADGAEALLTLCVEIDRDLGIGRNSAQAEILLARLLITKADFEAAEPVLRQAAGIVDRNGSHYDAACLLTARAMLACARTVAGELPPARGRKAATRLLEEAAARFASAGRMVTVDVDGLMKHVRLTLQHPPARPHGAGVR